MSAVCASVSTFAYLQQSYIMINSQARGSEILYIIIVLYIIYVYCISFRGYTPRGIILKYCFLKMSSHDGDLLAREKRIFFYFPFIGYGKPNKCYNYKHNFKPVSYFFS